MFKWNKPITQEIITPPKVINLPHEEFISMVVGYESGRLNSTDTLILFAFIIENEKWERYRYDWCIELMDYGVLTDSGMVNPYKLREYRNSKQECGSPAKGML